ncbi:MAG: hypothetical protein A4E41_01086 [Methanoregulaceae archaeon PtaU1.Bin066]|nr:MAG: hypothetical protein A4E41_01086 [Methanoregulaceae archaeon PtaU1.Bin066]
MRKDDPLGKARGPACIHDIDGIIEVKRLLPGHELILAHRLAAGDDLRPGEHPLLRFIAHEDDILQEWEFLGLQVPRARGVDFRACLAEHPNIVRGLEPALDNHCLDLGLLEDILELVRAVGRVDIHHDGSDPGGGALGQYPLGMVHCPDPYAISLLHPDRHKAPGEIVYPPEEFTVGVADPLVHRDQRIGAGILPGYPVQHLTYRVPEQRIGRGPAIIAACIHPKEVSHEILYPHRINSITIKSAQSDLIESRGRGLVRNGDGLQRSFASCE